MKLRIALAAASLLATASCASIMQGPRQGITVNSIPLGASITVDGQPMGVTPALLQLARKNEHVVRLDLAGYEPFEMTLTRKTSEWVWGNIVFGGLIGVAIDATNGSMYKLTPDILEPEMQTRTAVVDGKRTIQIAIVMTPDPSWEKIGQLQPE